jgi:hypothetical protein
MDDEKSDEGQGRQLAAESLVMPKSYVPVTVGNVKPKRQSFSGMPSLAVGVGDLTIPH